MLRASIIVKELFEPLVRDASEALFFLATNFIAKKNSEKLAPVKKTPYLCHVKNNFSGTDAADPCRLFLYTYISTTIHCAVSGERKRPRKFC